MAVVAVPACVRYIISAAARVMLCSNPRIKTSTDSLRQITNSFPLSPSWPNGYRCLPPNFRQNVLLFILFCISILSAINIPSCRTVKGKKEGGQKNTSAHAMFLHTSRLSYLPWRSPVRSPGIQTAVQLLPLHLNIEPVLL